MYFIIIIIISALATSSQTNKESLESYKTQEDVQIEILNDVQIEIITEPPAKDVGGTSDTPGRVTRVKRKAEKWINTMADGTEGNLTLFISRLRIHYWRNIASSIDFISKQ